MSSNQEIVAKYVENSAQVQLCMIDECVESILDAANIMIAAFKSGFKLLLCGNGGSAGDCQHMATELVSQLDPRICRPGLPALALTTDTSFLTAYSNDREFQGVFERQISALGRSGDVLLGISTSGKSQNVIKAIEMANSLEMKTIALTGSQGSSLKDLSDVTIMVPSENTQYIQESHLVVEHLLCHMVENAMFAEESNSDVVK